VSETESGRLAQPPGDTADRPDLPGEPDLADRHDAGRQRPVQLRRRDGQGQRQVGSRTASTIEARAESTPMTARRGLGSELGAASAWISAPPADVLTAWLARGGGRARSADGASGRGDRASVRPFRHQRVRKNRPRKSEGIPENVDKTIA